MERGRRREVDEERWKERVGWTKVDGERSMLIDGCREMDGERWK
jgi:hypothetical protein